MAEGNGMVERHVRASHAAGDAYIATLPTRLDQRPAGWRQTLAVVRARAALLAALDPDDEALVELMAKNGRPEDWARFDDIFRDECREEMRNALRAIKERVQGVSGS